MAVSHAMLSKLKVALIAGVVQNGQNDAAASMSAQFVQAGNISGFCWV